MPHKRALYPEFLPENIKKYYREANVPEQLRNSLGDDYPLVYTLDIMKKAKEYPFSYLRSIFWSIF